MSLSAAQIGILVAKRLGAPPTERLRLQTLIPAGLEKLARQVAHDVTKRQYLMTDRAVVTAAITASGADYFANLATIISSNGVMLDYLPFGTIYHTYATLATASGNVQITPTNTFTGSSSFPTGVKVQLTTTGAAPGGLSVNTDYYTIFSSSLAFRLATSRANAFAGIAITITTQGSGTHTVTPRESDVVQWMTRNFSGAESGLPLNYVYGRLIDSKLFIHSNSYYTGISGGPTLTFCVPAIPTLTNLHVKLEQDLIDVITELAQSGAEIGADSK